ncbi:MAG: formyltransferase family protein, partial [Candidatus Woesearchaeota archaeon]
MILDTVYGAKNDDERAHTMSELIYDPNKNAGPMYVVAFGSGSCSTIEKMLEHQHVLDQIPGEEGFKVAAIVTDQHDSQAHIISDREGIPLVYNNLDKFMEEQGMDPKDNKERRDSQMRAAFDNATKDMLLQCAEKNRFRIDMIALAGYMLRIYDPIVEQFSGKIINSHPADLSILDNDGRRKYTGANTVLDAILAGEPETRTSIHIVRKEVDAGEILVTSRPLVIDRSSLHLVDKACKYDMCPETMKLVLDYDHYIRGSTKMKRN